ncbi:MAG: FHA domain-containing protein [Planctomycetota bacterium]|nr:MAG: FHA domain-containing protein [Planctomycetota bacterium]
MRGMSTTLEGITLGELRQRIAEGLDLKAVLGETPVLVFRPEGDGSTLLFQTPLHGDEEEREYELAGDTSVFDRQAARKVVYAHASAIVVPLTPSNRNLYDDQVLVGRGRSNDVRLTAREVSKSHCAFSNMGGEGWTLTDLNSSNGTAVNGVPLEPDRPYRLRPSDEIEIAELAAVFLDAGGLNALAGMLE